MSLTNKVKGFFTGKGQEDYQARAVDLIPVAGYFIYRSRNGKTFKTIKEKPIDVDLTRRSWGLLQKDLSDTERMADSVSDSLLLIGLGTGLVTIAYGTLLFINQYMDRMY